MMRRRKNDAQWLSKKKAKNLSIFDYEYKKYNVGFHTLNRENVNFLK